MGNLFGNFFVKDKANRVNPYVTERGKEPNNCKGNGVKNNGVMPGGEEEAIKYVNGNTKQNCCTIKGDQVTKWSLSSPSSETNKVKLMTAESGITFLCHKDLKYE